MKPIVPVKGMMFVHARILSENADGAWVPATYVVTKVCQGYAYYKQPDERKAYQCCKVEDFGKYVKEILT